MTVFVTLIGCGYKEHRAISKEELEKFGMADHEEDFVLRKLKEKAHFSLSD